MRPQLFLKYTLMALIFIPNLVIAQRAVEHKVSYRITEPALNIYDPSITNYQIKVTVEDQNYQLKIIADSHHEIKYKDLILKYKDLILSFKDSIQRSINIPDRTKVDDGYSEDVTLTITINFGQLSQYSGRYNVPNVKRQFYNKVWLSMPVSVSWKFRDFADIDYTYDYDYSLDEHGYYIYESERYEEKEVVGRGDILLTAQDRETFTDDRDGRSYEIVKLGNQWVMAQNFAYLLENGTAWIFQNDSSNLDKYGYLYDWHTAGQISLEGWHLPSLEDYRDLFNSLGATGPQRYEVFADPAGFNASFVSGMAFPNGNFQDIRSCFWTSTARGANGWMLIVQDNQYGKQADLVEFLQKNGCSVRLFKNNYGQYTEKAHMMAAKEYLNYFLKHLRDSNKRYYPQIVDRSVFLYTLKDKKQDFSDVEEAYNLAVDGISLIEETDFYPNEAASKVINEAIGKFDQIISTRSIKKTPLLQIFINKLNLQILNGNFTDAISTRNTAKKKVGGFSGMVLVTEESIKGYMSRYDEFGFPYK